MEAPKETEFFYIESDGMVYLEERNGKLTLPTTTENLPFEIERKFDMLVSGMSVHFCKPLLEHHPRHWHHKDLIPGMDSAEPLVRLVVNMTHPRVVTEAVIIREGKLLLVKPSRGFNKGQWTLPGGFVSYGEQPFDAVRREVLEEVGAECRVESLLGVDTFVGKNSYYTWHMFYYQVSVPDGPFIPAADEIEEVRWFPLDEGLSQMQGIKRRHIEKYLPR